MALTVTEIQQLYTAYLGRPADQEGINYWQEQEVSVGQLRDSLANDSQPEYVELYGDRSRAEVVESIYQNMFGREADAEGLDYWVNGDGADVPASQLQQLFISAASATDRAAFNAQVAEDQADIDTGEPTNPQPTDTTDITFNTSTVGASEDIFGTFETTEDGGLTQIALPSGAGRNQQQTVTAIGKTEWDAAGQAVTTSADYTFNMADQLGAEKEYSGLFLSPLLTSESRSQNSQLFVELLDIRAAGTAQPLGELPIDGIRFNVDGEAMVLRSDAIFEAKTYPQLLNAVREAIAADSDLAGFTAEIGSSFTATDGGQPIPGAVGSTIVLTDSQGREITDGSFTYSDQATGGFTLYGDLSTEAPESVRDLISTNLQLDNVGYGSQGGSINLAGESNTDVSVEEFNVNAENGVWLSRLESQSPSGAQGLKEINLTGSGYFRVGEQTGQSVLGVADILNSWSIDAADVANEDGFDTGLDRGLESITGLVDVEKFNGQDFNGEIKLNAYLTDEIIDRDLNDTDDQANPAADNVNYTYQTAGGDDQISLVVQEGVLQREDALLNINAGNGNNLVETMIVDADGLPDQVVNQQLNENFAEKQVTIATGNGNDVVRTWGAGDATINTGAGNDVIYADNSGLIDLATGASVDGTVWEFNSTADATSTAPSEVSNSDIGLSAGANGVGQTFDAFKLQVQVSFKGFESVWVNVPHSGNQTTALQINQGIKDAVNNDAVLQNLIEANDGNGNILDIESLIDDANAGDLNIDFRGPLAAGTNNPGNRPVLAADETGATTDLAEINDIYEYDGGPNATGGNGNVYAGGGVASSVESDNMINAGAGNDVIVLGTGADSNDTVVIDGAFGRNSIVNFESDSADAGYDILDFSGILGVASDFDASIADTNGAIDAITYSAASYARDGVNWANLTGADVAASLEGSSVATTNTNGILMIQDPGGEGQYKAFSVSSTEASDDFTAQLLGIMDFGETQTFDAANFA